MLEEKQTAAKKRYCLWLFLPQGTTAVLVSVFIGNTQIQGAAKGKGTERVRVQLGAQATETSWT